MLQIPDTSIWLGNSSDLRDIRSILNTGVTAIIDLAVEEPMPELPRVTNYCRFTLTDDGENNPGTVRAAVLTAVSFIEGGDEIAICCNAGMNRSPSIAAATISYLTGRPPAHCLELVASVKHIDVNPALWDQIVKTLSRMVPGKPDDN